MSVESGVVTFRGHIKSAITRRWLQDNIASVNGVVGVNTDVLYDEQSIRLETGQVIPAGVQTNVRYGLVILSGFLNTDTTSETVAQAVTRIPGVERVVLDF
ncbi:MAG: BON domain-containing protein [Blastochloris sp.]|nr:BON domain-containing protein [Blastochloris sp.]